MTAEKISHLSGKPCKRMGKEIPTPYIVDGDAAHGLVAARDPESSEKFVISDAGWHGYDNMFCDEIYPKMLEHRSLKQYKIPASKLVLELSYNTDYDDEKEDWEADETDTVELTHLRPLYKDFMYWPRELYLLWVPMEVLPQYTLVDTLPSFTDGPCSSYGGWDDGYEAGNGVAVGSYRADAGAPHVLLREPEPWGVFAGAGSPPVHPEDCLH